MKTAVQWLVEELTYKTPEGIYTTDGIDDVTSIVEEALEMEKGQIIKANEEGRQTVVDLIIDYADTNPEELIRRFFHGNYSLREEAEDYYNKIYGK